MSYKSLREIVRTLADNLRPPERMTVAQAAEKYRFINQPGAYVGQWDNSTAPYMVEPMNVFASRDYNNIAFVGPAQSGKPIWIDTPVATPSGWTTMGEIKPGDVIFSEKGEPTEVTYVTPVFHERDCYRIEFDDGTEIIADGVHRWAVNDAWATSPYELKVKTTEELADSYQIKTKRGFRSRYAIPVTLPLDLPEVDLPVDPYSLGLWLGDGSSQRGDLTLGFKDSVPIRVSLTTRDIEYTLGRGKGNSQGTADRVCLLGVAPRLREMGVLNNKHIPMRYLRASEGQRRELLRGLMDTDGYIEKKGCAAIACSNKKLADGIMELLRSLGYKPQRTESTPTYTHKGEKLQGAVSYEMVFYPDTPEECTTLLRHIAKYNSFSNAKTRRPTHTGRRFIRAIEKVESVPVRCISVSNESHLFLVGEQMVPTHNTDSIVINGLAYSVKVDPMDTMLYCPTNTAARDFSIRRVDRLHRHSPEIGAMLLKSRDADNVMDKHYVTGMIFTLSWPSVTELAGRPVGRIIMTDFDRMPIDVGGDGNAFDLATKRTTTFGTFAMCAAESSPSHPILDLKWIPRSPHEAPPCTGIMALYNRGDRRRWHWPCLHCWTWFEGKFDLLVWDEGPESNLEKAATAHMACPHCGSMIHPDERHEMQQWGAWVPEGMHINAKGQLAGKRPRTTFASYWLRGTAAAFVTWPKLVLTYLDAHDEYERTGSEESLKKFWNNDMGEPYLPKMTDSIRVPEAMKSRAEELPEQMVPENVRFLVANVDVQKNAFVVQVHGILPGRPHDLVVIDRFNITKSKRTDEDGDPELVKPNAYLDDWKLIKEQVMDREYELADGSGRMMKVKFTTCDSGGQIGVTDRAYDFYRWLREQGENGRFILVKGDNKPTAPRTRISFPDAQKKDNKSAARGDIPLLMLNPNMLKDTLNGRLDVIEPGRGMYRYPKWLPDFWYAEMCAEVRTDKGWENKQKLRNEAWDLSYYCLGVCISPKLLNVEMIDWENPPAWADVWDKNALVRSREDPTRFMAQPKQIDFGKFAEALA